MKRENGITLISLVITAMVMAILAGITISATIGDDGLLTTAQNQKEKIKNSSVVAQAQIQLMKQSENDESGINYNELGKNLVQSKMINSYTTTENGLIGGITESNNTLVVCNSEVQVVSKSEQEKVVNGYKVSKDKTTPYSTLSFTAVQLKDGIKTIVLPDNTTVQFNNDLMATATYSISETGTYTFKIIDTKGKQTEQTINVKSIKKDAIILATDKNDWTNTNVILEATYPQYSSDYIKEISTDGGKTYSTYTNKISVSQNCDIKARVKKGDQIFLENSLSISKIDRDKPTAQVTVSKIVFGLNAQITGSDVGSGLNYNKCKYMINNSSTKLGENEALYTTGTLSGGSASLKKVMAGGTYYVHVLVTDKAGNKNEIVSSSVVVDSVLNYAYTGSSQNVELLPGKYKLEVWGAQGGYRSSSSYGGRGGYSVGTIALTENTKFFIYVGGSGNTGGTSGGFNGGGSRATYNGGGGGTDFRIGSDSLYARVIVAGGGGSDGATNKNGLYGGGTSGGSASQSYGYGGQGGTATSGGSGYSSGSSTPGSFGKGGQGYYSSSGYGGAGGGGWYGGAGSYPDSSGDDDRGGGGGSGYVYTSSTASDYPSGCLLNSSYYLSNASTTAGNESMPATSSGTETGHSGNGYARITNMN
ncbi:MAG: glycine-rich protein [Clostridia bacterium]|jgi:surface antigen bspA-like